MGRLVAGDLIKAPFPFSGEAEYKSRPCVVLAEWQLQNGKTDLLLCMMTTKSHMGGDLVLVSNSNLTSGTLPPPGTGLVRPLYLFACAEDNVLEHKGHLDDDTMARIKATIAERLGIQ